MKECEHIPCCKRAHGKTICLDFCSISVSLGVVLIMVSQWKLLNYLVLKQSYYQGGNQLLLVGHGKQTTHLIWFA